MHTTLEQGREAFEQQAWLEAYDRLKAADREASLDPEDLERLATAAYLVGEYADSTDTWARAHQELLSQNDVERAARCAFWLAFGLMNRGKRARAGGWTARARRLLDEGQRDCVEKGYLLLHVALQCLGGGDAASAYATFCQAAEIGDRFQEPNLIALARHSRGRLLIRMGEVNEGVTLLDEAMVTVEAEDLSPIVVGAVYCSVIEGCLEIFDVRRAQEWTAALSEWCAFQPDLVPYSGQCLVRRAEILQLHGAWTEAADAAQQACQRLLHGSGEPAAGAAFYQKAELHRRCGAFAEAEETYRQANQWGRKPQPGLAQLRLDQGRINAAEAAIRRAVDEAQGRGTRSLLLPAHVEIMLAAEDIPAARTAAEELSKIASELEAPLLRAEAAQAHGAVLLAEDDAPAALAALRQAWTDWQEIEAPYEAARVRVLIGRACQKLGDHDTAAMQLDAARCVFQRLGASPDLDRLEALSRTGAPKDSGKLTAREVQVIRLVAAGKTNQQIADELFISEKTVARHMSNIFSKLELPNRAAATGYAYEHDLV